MLLGRPQSSATTPFIFFSAVVGVFAAQISDTMMVRHVPFCFVFTACIFLVCVSEASSPRAQAYGKLPASSARVASRLQPSQFQRRQAADQHDTSHFTSSESVKRSLVHETTLSSALSHNFRGIFRRLSRFPNGRSGSGTPESREQPRQSGTGLSGDSCESATDCKTPRRCLDAELFQKDIAEQCSSSSVACLCHAFRICSSSLDCDEGEECAEITSGEAALCFSVQFLQENDFKPIPTSENAEASISGVNGDSCQSDSDCRGNRRCESSRSENSCSASDVRCFCFERPLLSCDADSDCDDGESCQSAGGDSNCLTEKVDIEQIAASQGGSSPQSGEAESNVCIAMHSLQHLDADQLLFAQPRMAHVLCDSNNSCATPGHMVCYNEELMMMKTYCEKRGCTPRVMAVNSPRFRRAMRIESNTEALSFTAIAARYETNAEERLLSLGVRVGLL